MADKSIKLKSLIGKTIVDIDDSAANCVELKLDDGKQVILETECVLSLECGQIYGIVAYEK